MTSYDSENFVKEKTCSKNAENPNCIYLFITNSRFQNTTRFSSSLCDFDKVTLVMITTTFQKSSLNKNLFIDRISPLEVFLGNVVLKICSKFKGEHSCRSVILIKLLCVAITLWRECSPVNLLHIFRITFLRNTSGGLLLY